MLPGHDHVPPHASDGGRLSATTTPRVSLVVAMGSNRAIGAQGKLPWHIPEDLKRFKALTLGHPIVMGRKTYESIGRLLPGRTSVIVTRERGYAVPGALVAHSLDAALVQCTDAEEVFVIGGGELFAEALARAQRIYLTHVDLAPPADTFFPPLDPAQWREVRCETLARRSDGTVLAALQVLERV